MDRSDTDLSSYASKRSIATPTGKANKDRIVRSLRRSYDDAVDSWSDSDLKGAFPPLLPLSLSPCIPSVADGLSRTQPEWLSDHGVPLPPKPKHQQLVDTVKAHYASASTYVSGGSTFSSAQKVFQQNSDKAFASWDESQLREFLLEQGVVSPSSKREELVVQAKKYYADGASLSPPSFFLLNLAQALELMSVLTAGSAARAAASSASSAAAAATGGPTSSLSSAWYTATDAPYVAYDYLSDTYDDARDYVWSAWSDNDLKAYLVEKGLIKGDVEKKRDDYVKLIKDSYNGAADNVYETCTSPSPSFVIIPPRS